MCFSFRAKPCPWCRQHLSLSLARQQTPVTASLRAFSRFALHIPTEGSFYLPEMWVELPLAAELSLPKGTKKEMCLMGLFKRCQVQIPSCSFELPPPALTLQTASVH